MSSTKAAFIGLGVMGYPMAGHMAKAGHDVTVYNRTAEKAENWAKEHGGASAGTPAQAAEAAGGADIVCACVGNDDDLRSIVFGDDGILAGMKKGAILVDHTTASATIAREIDAQAHEQGIGFLDAPVSGGQAGAENGVLTVMVGGEQGHFDTAKPVIETYARAMNLMGPAGSGQLTKCVNQIFCIGVIQGLAEGLSFAQNAGLDARKVIDVISKGAAQSWQMDNRAETMIDGKFDFGFAVEWMKKDLGIVLSEAETNGADLPMTTLINGFYGEIMEMGGNRWDCTSLIKRLSPES